MGCINLTGAKLLTLVKQDISYIGVFPHYYQAYHDQKFNIIIVFQRCVQVFGIHFRDDPLYEYDHGNRMLVTLTWEDPGGEVLRDPQTS